MTVIILKIGYKKTIEEMIFKKIFLIMTCCILIFPPLFHHSSDSTPHIRCRILLNMDDQFLDEFNGRFDDIITFFILVIMIVPMNNIGLLIITDDAAFSDAGPAGITHIVGDARIDVIAMIFIFKFFIFFWVRA